MLDPLAAVYAAVAAYAAAEPGTPPGYHVRAAIDAYFRVPRESEPAARDAVAALVPYALGLSAETQAAVRDDPAAPDLNHVYRAVLATLGDLATVFAAPGPDASAGEHAGEYQAVCAEIRTLMAAGEQARPVWDLLR